MTDAFRKRQFVKSLGMASVVTIACVVQAQPEVASTTQVGTAEYLVDGDGRALYTFMEDAQDVSNCSDACAEAWPPFVLEGELAVADGLDEGDFGSFERDDGTVQVTYGGMPLYRFAQDDGPNTTLGDGVNDVWHLATPLSVDAEDEADSGDVDLMSLGQRVYGEVCSTCHGVNGDSTNGGAVVLAGNDRLDNGPRVARQVLYGGEYMPSFGQALSSAEVASVVTFIRNSWGNTFGEFTEEEVDTERAKFE